VPVREEAEPRAEASEPAPRVHAPVVAGPLVEFHAVSEHDAVAEEAHRPVRRRRQGQSDAQAQSELQMVETQADVAVSAAPQEDELPRRTKPRRRREGAVADEPLKLVETQPGSEGARPDGQP
jgi:hypothetical protein